MLACFEDSSARLSHVLEIVLFFQIWRTLTVPSSPSLLSHLPKIANE